MAGGDYTGDLLREAYPSADDPWAEIEAHRVTESLTDWDDWVAHVVSTVAALELDGLDDPSYGDALPEYVRTLIVP